MQPKSKSSPPTEIPEVFHIDVPNPNLMILIGIQGSGKSTFAYEHFAPVEILSMDELRARLCNDTASQSNSCAARIQLLDILRQRLRNRVTTVVDSTNLRADQRAELRLAAKEFGTPVTALVFTAGAALCRERIDNRATIIRNDVLARNAVLLERTLETIDNEGCSVVIRLDDQQLKSVRLNHALPDDPDPGRWFEVEQVRPGGWIFRRPVDELRRHPAVLARTRPTWVFVAGVAADMALDAQNASTGAEVGARIGAEVHVRLPHCLPIQLVGQQNAWERKSLHATGS